MTFIDWVQIISAVAGGVAAILAYIAIRQSAKNSRENQEALIRERRIDFELDALEKIAAMLSPLFAWSKAEDFTGYLKQEEIARRIWMLCTVLGDGQLPLLRGLVRADTIPEAKKLIGDRELDSLADDELSQGVQKEIVDAIKSRLAARSR